MRTISMQEHYTIRNGCQNLHTLELSLFSEKMKGSIRLHNMDSIMRKEHYESTNVTMILAALQRLRTHLSGLPEEPTRVGRDILSLENGTVMN